MSGGHKHEKINYSQVSARLHKHLVSRSCGYLGNKLKIMNKTFSNTGKQILKDLLAQCTEPQQDMFKLMYGRDGGKRSVEDAKAMDINNCVDLMDDAKIDWAISQCERTVEKNLSKAVS